MTPSCAIAMGSASELDYDLLLARALKLFTTVDYTDLAQTGPRNQTSAPRTLAEGDR
jgi:hypothetical protein